MIELEYKSLFSKEQHEQCIEYLKQKLGPADEDKLQVNYYYDNGHLSFAEQGITIRIRQKNEKLKLQIKTPIGNKNKNINAKNEIEADIEELCYSFKIEDTPIISLLEGEVSLLGVLITERKSWKKEDKFSIDIDKNIYLGVVDYEIECEFKNEFKVEAEAFLKDVLSSLNMDYRKSESKVTRFFKRLDKVGG
ncbi:CYTH domain-containing protein [Viridibacillus arvi]|uniref:CYTH domain-containing protein n=1 Tax=Viridibacillus arvi TaxID=263475 RepID=UPI0034CDB0F0